MIAAKKIEITHSTNWNKAECFSLMVIWSEFRMGQYRADDDREAPLSSKWIIFNLYFIWNDSKRVACFVRSTVFCCNCVILYTCCMYCSKCLDVEIVIHMSLLILLLTIYISLPVTVKLSFHMIIQYLNLRIYFNCSQLIASFSSWLQVGSKRYGISKANKSTYTYIYCETPWRSTTAHLLIGLYRIRNF